jgi:YD repeat-containing protein
LPYNPALAAGGEAQLVLTAPDGTAYHLDAAHGVTAIVASSGKRLVVSDSGIVAANGEAVRFVSNSDGQLASISGPDGERIVYGYDGEGRLSSVRRIADSESTHYGYEVGPAGRLSIVTGAHDLAIDYSAATPVAAGAHRRSRRRPQLPGRRRLPATCGRGRRPAGLRRSPVRVRVYRERIDLPRRRRRSQRAAALCCREPRSLKA